MRGEATTPARHRPAITTERLKAAALFCGYPTLEALAAAMDIDPATLRRGLGGRPGLLRIALRHVLGAGPMAYVEGRTDTLTREAQST